MSSIKTCKDCGTPLLDDEPLGLCPRCLVYEGLGETITHVPSQKKRVETSKSVSVASLEEVVEAVRALEVLAIDELDQIVALSGEDPADLVRSLVREKKLTAYQGGAIVQGKARGLVIGRYLVEDKLGVGGMGVVFKAKHRPSERVVALKMLPPAFGREAESVRRFQREFRIAGRLSHPNLVQAIEEGEDRGVHYLTMEYIPGYDLDRLVNHGGPMDLKLALHCVIQVARGMEAAHAQGVIHRDIKPANIMIDQTGAIRVLDLGLARVLEASSCFGPSAKGTLTQTGMYMGTVDFLAPEQANDAKSADARADIYSLACTLYFLLTAKPPFTGDSVFKRVIAHMERPAPFLREVRPDVPQALEDIYQQMMSKRPVERPQSMSEVVIKLESCRTSAREAGDASTDLKTFAWTILKQSPVQKEPNRDTSVYARPTENDGGPSLKPDVKIEEIVADSQPESAVAPISPDNTSSVVQKSLPGRFWSRRRPEIKALGAVAVLVVAIGTVGYNLKIWRNDPAETVSEPKLVQPDAKQIDPGQNSAVPKPTPSLAKEIMTKTADIKLLLIPAGKFMMGASESDPNATEPEKPSHEVTISRSFYLGRTEVTVGQFRKFVDSTNYATISERDGWGGWGFDDNRNFVQAPQFSWRNTGFDQTDEHPVTNVAWGDARAFVEWLSKEEGRLIRLPTEAEWEYACRAGTTTIWSGTDDETNALESAWTSENSAKQAHAVAQKKPNAFGLFDMHGNIQEYCGDVYEESFYVGSASKDPVNLNPQVFLKVLRGGAWWHPSLMARSASRDKIDPSKRFFCWGFRIASSLTPQEREIQPN